MAGKQVKKGARRGFYGPALDETAALRLEEASGVEGLDQEIALLRVIMCDLIKDDPENVKLHLKAAGTIASLVRIRYSISKEQKKSLREAISKVLTELAVPLGVKTLLK